MLKDGLNMTEQDNSNKLTPEEKHAISLIKDDPLDLEAMPECAIEGFVEFLKLHHIVNVFKDEKTGELKYRVVENNNGITTETDHPFSHLFDLLKSYRDKQHNECDKIYKEIELKESSISTHAQNTENAVITEEVEFYLPDIHKMQSARELFYSDIFKNKKYEPNSDTNSSKQSKYIFYSIKEVDKSTNNIVYCEYAVSVSPHDESFNNKRQHKHHTAPLPNKFLLNEELKQQIAKYQIVKAIIENYCNEQVKAVERLKIALFKEGFDISYLFKIPDAILTSDSHKLNKQKNIEHGDIKVAIIESLKKHHCQEHATVHKQIRLKILEELKSRGIVLTDDSLRAHISLLG